MEWERQLPEELHDIAGDGMFVKVMTDEQIVILQKQIAAYCAISEQLVELHKSHSLQNDLSGVRLGSMLYDPTFSSGVHKITGRQRWTPTPPQLEILERTFNEEGSIGKPKIPELTTRLLQHGQISETNVYNWFQNRRARSKRKQKVTPSSRQNNNADSEVETHEIETNSSKIQNFQPQNVVGNSRNGYGQAMDPFGIGTIKPVLPTEGSSSFDGSFEHIPYYEIWNGVSNARDGSSGEL